MSKEAKKTLSCTECNVLNCYRCGAHFPDFCLTENAPVVDQNAALKAYKGNGADAKFARSAAEIEGKFYGKLTRVEEIIQFAKRIQATRIGIATCIGLIEESRIFSKILRAHHLEPYGVICKVGATDKTEIGIPEELKVQPGCHESLCNPVLQARLLNRKKTQLNIVVGLCVGHDSLFIKHSKAPVTTLITKDRILGHNPAAALYTSNFYYKRLLHPTNE